MNTALSLSTMPAAEVKAEASITDLIEGTRTLIETVNTTLETVDGKGKQEIGLALANILNAVAKRIENN